MRLVFSILLASIAAAQPPAARPLEYGGRPIAVPSECTAELVQSADLACSADQPCPLFLELSDAERVGDRIVLTGNVHTSSRTLESLLLTSEDLGKTWTEPLARIPFGVLDRIQFLDFETGWISGHVLNPSPRDAFFLLTGDGGRTWRKRTVYGEPRFGAIEQFWFDTRLHGTMLFDKGQGGDNGMRYEVYETMTRGENWNIRQVDSKPIPFRMPAAAQKPLRIRADAKLKAYVIERQQDSRWQPLASFLVAAGECKPPEPAAEEPQPPAPQEAEAPPQSQAPRQPPSLRRKNAP